MDDSKLSDGGWGWMIAFAGFSIQFLVSGQIKSYGILMIEIIDSFGSSATLTGFVAGLAQGLSFGFAPITCMLVNKYGHRGVVIAGGLAAGIGMTLCYFASTVGILFLTYGLIFGIGVGLVMNPAMTMYALFFKTRLSFVGSLIAFGNGFGSFCFPWILQFLLLEFNLQSVFLVCGGMTFNVVVAGCLMRPPAQRKCGLESKTDDIKVTEKHKADASKSYANKMAASDSVKNVETSPAKSTRRLHHWYLLRDPYYVVFSLGRMADVLANINVFILLPLKVNELGEDVVSEAGLLSLLSLSELATKFFWGFLWDVGPFRRPAVRQVGLSLLLVLAGVNLLLIGVARTVIFLTVLVVAMGVLLSGMMTPMLPIMVDILGRSRVGDGIGINMFGQAIVLVCGPLITGVILDKTQSTTGAFMLMAAAEFVSAALTFAVPVMFHYDVKRPQIGEQPPEKKQKLPSDCKKTDIFTVNESLPKLLKYERQ